jgi:hypothetical protein
MDWPDLLLGHGGCTPSSIVVRNLDILGAGVSPAKNDPVLIVYADRVPARQVPSQRLEAVSGRERQVPQFVCGVQMHKLPPGDAGDLARKTSRQRLIGIASAALSLKLLIVNRRSSVNCNYVSISDTYGKK